jgi:hypothetical protein
MENLDIFSIPLMSTGAKENPVDAPVAPEQSLESLNPAGRRSTVASAKDNLKARAAVIRTQAQEKQPKANCHGL